jgi:acetyl esterase/lipase
VALASLSAAGASLLPSRALGSQLPPRPASDKLDTAHGNREFVYLWPEHAPLAVGSEPIDRPKLTLYRAEGGSGAAVVVCPGGSYRSLASTHEGREVAEWLNGLGISAFVLQYRLGPRYHHPAPLLDAQRAIRLVRAHAAGWNADPRRVGILGFSAGGHLASTAGTHFDLGDPTSPDRVERESSRPDFMVLAYPVITLKPPFAHAVSREHLLGAEPDQGLVESLSNETQVTSETPPTFVWHTDEDTGVLPENSIFFYEALRKAKVPAELHVFTRGAHGLGLAAADPAASAWPRLCAAWLEAMGFLKR